MSFLGLVVLTAALLPLLTRGSYRRLAEAPWRWAGLLALGLALQLLLDTDLIPRSRWHDIGFGMLVASYVLLIGFCAGNVIVRGMSVVLIGVALQRVRRDDRPGHARARPSRLATRPASRRRSSTTRASRAITCSG